MATKKTSMFTLTDRLTIAANATDTRAVIDLGSYVDVGDRQALQIHSVDYIFQGTTADNDAWQSTTSDASVIVQVADLNRGGLVFANDRALVASGVLAIPANAQYHQESDLYPDNYGKGADDGRFVVNDALYVTGRVTGGLDTGNNATINVTVRVNASIVTLSQKDFMAIAIQSTAADN